MFTNTILNKVEKWFDDYYDPESKPSGKRYLVYTAGGVYVVPHYDVKVRYDVLEHYHIPTNGIYIKLLKAKKYDGPLLNNKR